MSNGRRLAGRSDIDPVMNYLIKHRVRSRITQEEVAVALGVSKGAVSHWETGRVNPSLTQARQYARVVGLALIPADAAWWL